jgi:hypothetical protein
VVVVIGALALACGCTVRQARIARRAGEITAGAALVGLLATVVAAELWDDQRQALLEGGIAFVPISIAGVAVYIASDTMLGPEDDTVVAHPRAWTAAMDLAKEAKRAARRGDCAEVQAIESRVRELDTDVYGRFLRDQLIRTCLGPQ